MNAPIPFCPRVCAPGPESDSRFESLLKEVSGDLHTYSDNLNPKSSAVSALRAFEFGFHAFVPTGISAQTRSKGELDSLCTFFTCPEEFVVEMTRRRMEDSSREVSSIMRASQVARALLVVTGYSPMGTVSWSQSGPASVSLSSTTCTLTSVKTTLGTCFVTMTGTTAGKVTLQGNMRRRPEQSG